LAEGFFIESNIIWFVSVLVPEGWCIHLGFSFPILLRFLGLSAILKC